MKVIIITGSCGLIDQSPSNFSKNYLIVGVDNNLRKYFFGKDGNTSWQLSNLKKLIIIFTILMILEIFKNLKLYSKI